MSVLSSQPALEIVDEIERAHGASGPLRRPERLNLTRGPTLGLWIGADQLRDGIDGIEHGPDCGQTITDAGAMSPHGEEG